MTWEFSWVTIPQKGRCGEKYQQKELHAIDKESRKDYIILPGFVRDSSEQQHISSGKESKHPQEVGYVNFSLATKLLRLEAHWIAWPVQLIAE